MPKTESKDKAGEFQVVSFKVDDKQYAIDITKIIEIIYYKKATPLPQSPEFIEGVVDLRNRVIPVLDLKKRLQLLSKTDRRPNHILIVRVHDKTIGIVVDEVQQVLSVDEGQIQAPQHIFKGTGSKHLRGVCKVNEQLLFILSPDTLLSGDEQARLEGI
ncbi:MAG: purine-binding chemotaxis protein CheW [Nitrospirae bacterium]|nr:purine-binding chemotaxis protein CheW [Nitrospirota bacterium]